MIHGSVLKHYKHIIQHGSNNNADVYYNFSRFSKEPKTYILYIIPYTVKPLNSGRLRLLKSYSVIERCPFLGGNLKKTV